MTAGQPIASVVIPAYNEAKVIGRCLRVLLERGEQLLVVVAANGCTDDTADQARAFGVDVVEVERASKTAALNAADQRCGDVFPRIYLDADIVLRAADAMAVVNLLKRSTSPLACAPRIAFDVGRASRTVRAFYRIYAQMPYIGDGMIGSGCYAVNSAGRRRWREFPEMTADDLFVQGKFAESERRVIETSTFVVAVPKTVCGLLKVRTRTYLGNLQAARLDVAGSMAGSRGGSLSALGHLCREQPTLIRPALVYLVINLVASLRSRVRNSDSAWLTDSTSRTDS